MKKSSLISNGVPLSLHELGDPRKFTLVMSQSGAVIQHVVPAIISEKRLRVPTSIPALSETLSVQLPLAFWPSNTDNGLSGVKFPDTAPVVGMVEAAGKPPSSSRRTVQKLLPAPPRLVIKATVVPPGEVSLKDKSLLNV